MIAAELLLATARTIAKDSSSRRHLGFPQYQYMFLQLIVSFLSPFFFLLSWDRGGERISKYLRYLLTLLCDMPGARCLPQLSSQVHGREQGIT